MPWFAHNLNTANIHFPLVKYAFYFLASAKYKIMYRAQRLTRLNHDAARLSDAVYPASESRSGAGAGAGAGAEAGAGLI